MWDRIDAFRAEDCIENSRKLLVIVADQKPNSGLAFGQPPHALSGLLLHPRAVRMRGAAGEMDASTPNLAEREDIDRL